VSSELLRTSHEYRVTRLIAHGGMGSVFEAQQSGAAGFAKTVAIKTVRRQLAADPEFTRLFIAEAKLVADLVHENIVQVYSLNLSDEGYFIVMEHVEGINLAQYLEVHLRNGWLLPVELGAFIASRVCRGLEYAHQRRDRDGNELGIVHRDISPKNVLLSFEGVVKVTDFGIAKAREVMEQDEKVLMGRMEYMSPEQARRSATDRRSDIYSLGVLLYELLSGEVPTRGAGSLERLHRLGMSYSRPIQNLRPELPDPLCAIIDRALQPEPADRYQTAGEMGFALEYHLYHRGYGPTNVTLRDYVQAHFPLPRPGAEPLPERRGPTGQTLEQRADTLFGDRLGGHADE
jgi:serine/threonine protein kinase